MIWIFAPIAGFVLLCVLLKWRFAEHKTTFGAAGWLPAWTASGRGLFQNKGLLTGDWTGRLPVFYSGNGHALTVAPTGRGKGTCAIIPNLLRHPWIFLLDPGGENTAIACKAWRRKGYKFVCLNPWRMHAGAPWSLPQDTLNPLSILDPDSPGFVSDADLLAEMIVTRSQRESGNSSFFKDEAQSGIKVMLMHIATTEPAARRNLVTLRKHIVSAATEWGALLDAMIANSAAGGAVAREAQQFARREAQAPEEFSAVLSTMKQDTNFLEDPIMQRALSGSSADLGALKGSSGGKRIPGCVVSVVMPLQYLDTHSAYARLIMAVALWTMQSGPLSRGRVLFLMDEFPALGRMSRVATGLATLRKYRVWLWPIIQNLGQLKILYGENWQTFISNAGLLQFMGAGDLETARYVSALCGEATIEVKSKNPGGISTYLTKRALATPEELLYLADHLQVVSAHGLKPMLLHKTPYWQRADLRGRFHPNPYQAGTPDLPWWFAFPILWGASVRLAAWLVRPASSLVALATMMAVFAANPAILVQARYDSHHRELLCGYASLTGPYVYTIRNAPYHAGCAPVHFRGMNPVVV
ncbi:MAG: conjugal transfer protein TraG [Planctomycetota bacterium]|nr:MAG: conjugal transfer protein TraG [Planctomycetota bacterium]